AEVVDARDRAAREGAELRGGARRAERDGERQSGEGRDGGASKRPLGRGHRRGLLDAARGATARRRGGRTGGPGLEGGAAGRGGEPGSRIPLDSNGDLHKP